MFLTELPAWPPNHAAPGRPEEAGIGRSAGRWPSMTRLSRWPSMTRLSRLSNVVTPSRCTRLASGRMRTEKKRGRSQKEKNACTPKPNPNPTSPQTAFRASIVALSSPPPKNVCDITAALHAKRWPLIPAIPNPQSHPRIPIPIPTLYSSAQPNPVARDDPAGSQLHARRLVVAEVFQGTELVLLVALRAARLQGLRGRIALHMVCSSGSRPGSEHAGRA